MTPADTRVLETRAGPDTLGEIAVALDRAWSRHPVVPVTIRMQMAIAAGEIGANILEHAAQGQPVRVCMDVDVLPGEVCIDFLDEGRPLQIDLGAVRLPDELSERGRGLALAQAVLESLTYRRTAVNHWTLVSKRFD